MNLAELMKKADQMTVKQDSETNALDIAYSTTDDEIRSLEVSYSVVNPIIKGKNETETTKKSETKKQELKEMSKELAAELLAKFDPLKKLGLTVELTGFWFWISGDTKPHRTAIKAIEIPNYKKGFSKSKQMWYFSPIGYRKRTRKQWSKEEIDEKFDPIEL